MPRHYRRALRLVSPRWRVSCILAARKNPRRKLVMRTLVEITFTSLDGVIDAPAITTRPATVLRGRRPARSLGTHLFDHVDWPTRLRLSAERRFDSGAVVLEYTRGDD